MFCQLKKSNKFDVLAQKRIFTPLQPTDFHIIYNQFYYPFGMVMPGRSISSSSYRYGFNGQEKDDEVSGNGNFMTAEFWQYDSRLGRRWNLDPVVKYYLSNYSTFANNPILQIDPKGNDWYKHNNTGKVVWIDTQGQDVEGYTFLGEYRYWDNNFNFNVANHWEYFDFLGRGTKATRILKNTVAIAGGVLAIGIGISAAAAATPIIVALGVTSGCFSIASGSAQLVLNLNNDQNMANKVPSGYLSAVVGLTVEYTVDGEKYEEEIKVLNSTLNVTESVLTMDLEKLPVNALEATNIVITGLTISENAMEAISKTKEIIESEKAKKSRDVQVEF